MLLHRDYYPLSVSLALKLISIFEHKGLLTLDIYPETGSVAHTSVK